MDGNTHSVFRTMKILNLETHKPSTNQVKMTKRTNYLLIQRNFFIKRVKICKTSWNISRKTSKISLSMLKLKIKTNWLNSNRANLQTEFPLERLLLTPNLLKQKIKCLLDLKGVLKKLNRMMKNWRFTGNSLIALLLII